MAKRPKTLSEWADYISGLEGLTLRSKAKAANSYGFVQDLRKEGMDLYDIEALFVLFAQQFARTGQKAPEIGAFNLRELALANPPERVLSEEEVMSIPLSEEPEDDVESFVKGLDGEVRVAKRWVAASALQNP